MGDHRSGGAFWLIERGIFSLFWLLDLVLLLVLGTIRCDTTGLRYYETGANHPDR